MSRYIDVNMYRNVLIGASQGYYDNSFEKVLDAIPTANVAEVKHGEWMDTHVGLGTCSCCGFYNAINPYFNYCPNCGADMCKILPNS